eukprot:Skav232940  [mRNA]  locus=scaffold3689:10243:11682:- [translate_table: standard]
MMKNMAAVMIHLTFLFCLSAAWNFLQGPSLSTLCPLVAGIFEYAMSFFVPEMINTEARFHKVEAAMVLLHALVALGLTNETDVATFDIGERLATIGVASTSIVMIDFKVFMPFYVCQSALLIYSRWCLVGFAKMTPVMVLMPVVSYIVLGGVSTLTVLNIQSNIASKLDSGEATSLMLGFRSVLRGVCDGDVVLDRRTMTIVDDATCLERLLKSQRRLSNSNFLDTFLDSDGREQFSKFLAEDAETGIPRGLRVSLQGARGPVSVDLFSTALPRSGGSDYCLLAMKEDPLEQLQTAPPEAPPDSAPDRIPQQAVPPEGSRSSESERLVAYDDLHEVGLLVSDATGLLDIEQVHLAFQRKSAVSNIESGMPTLRRIIRPSDWDRIEKMFDIVTNLPLEDRHERCYFRRPTYFRVPGESRRYMCAKYTSLRLADESIEPGRPSRFWMHLGQFVSSQKFQKQRSLRSQRSWEQQLEDIEEEQ